MTVIIGPCHNKRNRASSKIGGIVVLFENFINYCDNVKFQYALVDSNKSSYRFKWLSLIVIYLKICLKSIRCDKIFMHGTMNDYVYIAPFVSMLGVLLHKKVFYRKFAGDFDKRYERLGRVKKIILDWSLRHAECLFWETKHLVCFGTIFNANSFWFPNVREPYTSIHSSEYSKKLVFISQVRREKGVDYLLELADILPSEYMIDIYGPIVDSKYCESILCKGNMRYRGIINNSEVQSVLLNYDILLLPTYWHAEGYPGIIIEAFSVGLPVIATCIGGIPEIVSDGVNGKLIRPHNIEDLYNSILSIDIDTYESLSKGAQDSFLLYNSDEVNSFVIDKLSN